MIYINTANHDAVFAVRSIAWSQALPCYEVNIMSSHFMRNLVNAVANTDPLPGKGYAGEEEAWR